MTALVMDSGRQDLFVEGKTDREIIRSIAGEPGSCIITEIDLVDVIVDEGGNRARALKLAAALRSAADVEAARVRVFVDADFDHIESTSHARPVVLTDGRCMESYFYTPRCLESVMGLGFLFDEAARRRICGGVDSVCLELAALRQVDREHSYALPFQSSKINKFVTVDNDDVASLQIEGLVSKLVAMAGHRSAVAQQVLDAAAMAVETLTQVPLSQVLHGHDFEIVLGEVLRKHKSTADTAMTHLRSAWDIAELASYPNLTEVVEFVRG